MPSFVLPPSPKYRCAMAKAGRTASRRKSFALARLSSLPDGRRDLEGQCNAPPPPACCGRAAAAREICWVFIDKKGEPLNPLKSLEPKRQLLTDNRHDWSGDR